MHIFRNRLRQGLFGLLTLGILAIAGCATTGSKDIKPADSQAKEETKKTEEEKRALKYINVVGDGDKVIIEATGPLKYTAFKLTEPARLIIDMPDVNLDKISSPITVNNNYIKDITVLSYGEKKEIGRIIIGLKEGVDHDVKSGENSVLVMLKNAVSETAQQNPPPQETVKEEPVKPDSKTVETNAGTKEGAVEKETIAKAPEAKPATMIIKVESSKEGKKTVIKIVTDGTIGNYNSFSLDSPNRIVLDIWGVANSTGKDVVNIKSKYIKAVRIGDHPDKARLVFDASGANLPPHSIKKFDNSIILTLGPGVTQEAETQAAKDEKAASPAVVKEEKAAQAEKAAPVEGKSEDIPAAVKPAAPEVSIAKVEKVDYKQVDDKGRLTIATSEKTEYRIKETADGKTLVIDLVNAVIPDELSRTLDASKLNTPVLSVSSYQESVLPLKDVRLLVKLKDKSVYAANQANGMIVVDFRLPQAPAEAAKAAAKAEPITEAGEAQQPGYHGKRIDLDMMDANIADVLRLLAEVSNLNIIASDDVKGTISLRLKNVPWDQAFDIILKSKDLGDIREGNVVRVAPMLKIRQEKEAALASKKAEEKLGNLDTKFIPVNYASASDLEKQVKGVLTERGSVTSDVRTNTLIIKDIQSGIDASSELVARLDTKIPQVLIEARIVEAASSFARNLGIQWGADFQTSGHVSTNTFGTASGITTPTPVPAPPTTMTTNPPNPQPTPIFVAGNGTKDFAVNLPSANTLGAIGFVLGKAGTNPLLLDLRLSAGESEGHLKTISRPRITTMDNKEAKISQGESIPFETTSASGTSTIFVDANLSLTVTPHITSDGSVRMKVVATRNAIGSFRTAAGQPSINAKQATTEVLVMDGETTVIGGIVISDKSDTEQGIPFLRNLPVIGWLFKSKSVSDNQTELLIFITPTIVKDKISG